MNTVLVTSAIHTNYGVYDTAQRIQQTLDTVRSARKHIPDAVIYLIDNSKIDVQQDNSAEFNELIDAVDYYIDNSGDADIQYFHNNVENYDVGKNSMECLGMLKALGHIASEPELLNDLRASDRVYKLSGRYILTEEFDIKKFDNKKTKGKFVFKKRQAAWIPQEQTGVDFLLQTRLWSFPSQKLDYVIDMFKHIIDNMFASLNKQQYIDIEHSMAKFIPSEDLVELDTVGLTGNIAPNGAPIKD